MLNLVRKKFQGIIPFHLAGFVLNHVKSLKIATNVITDVKLALDHWILIACSVSKITTIQRMIMPVLLMIVLYQSMLILTKTSRLFVLTAMKIVLSVKDLKKANALLVKFESFSRRINVITVLWTHKISTEKMKFVKKDVERAY